MKWFLSWTVPAGLVLAITSAHAQTAAPKQSGHATVTAVSDVDAPYVATPPDRPGYYAPDYDGPRVMPGSEVYAVLRDNGFSPLGIPRQRGFFYTIAAMDRRGNDGRLVIDGRDGRILRFMPAYRSRFDEGYGPRFDDGYGPGPGYGPPPGYGPESVLPPINQSLRGAPRPPSQIPQIASRTPQAPLPKSSPLRAGEAPVAASPKVAMPPAVSQSMAMQAKPAAAPKPAEVAKLPQNTAPAPTDAKAAPSIQPTEAMPKVQGLE
jgi:hypothetical protein